jgi:hypothetical protein
MRAGGVEIFRGANELRAMSRKDASQAGILDGLSVACELTFRSKIPFARTHRMIVPIEDKRMGKIDLFEIFTDST